MINTDKQILKHDKDMTSEWKKEFSGKFKGLYVDATSCDTSDTRIKYVEPKFELKTDEVKEFIKSLLSQQREQVIYEIFHAVNDGIFDDVTYIPRKGRRGLKDDWWSGVDDVCSLVDNRLDSVRKKYKITPKRKEI